MTNTPREKMDAFLRASEESKVHYAVRALDGQLSNPHPDDPGLVALLAAKRETRRRFDQFNATRTSESVAEELREWMTRPSTSRDAVESIAASSMEHTIRLRFPEADEASDDYLDSLDPNDLPDDEYAHLRVLLETAGL